MLSAASAAVISQRLQKSGSATTPAAPNGTNSSKMMFARLFAIIAPKPS